MLISFEKPKNAKGIDDTTTKTDENLYGMLYEYWSIFERLYISEMPVDNISRNIAAVKRSGSILLKFLAAMRVGISHLKLSGKKKITDVFIIRARTVRTMLPIVQPLINAFLCLYS